MQEQTIRSFTEYKGRSQPNSGPSDLLIPLYLESHVLKQIRKHKNLRNYFHFLIVKFQKKNLFSKFSDTAFRKTLYQSKHLQLIRYSFRPDHQDWYEAKFAGFYFGISVCRFFSRLVDLDIEDDSQIKNLREELIKLTKTEIGPLHFYFTIISNRKIILKKLVRGKNFELNSA
ncbi:DUF1564 family protein [Leptospira yasudae]|uniref:DUF1564 family protein n=1 Tax=Leptospira yasudae TaxID=2202201 RepID=A0A6N4QV23_9LEPT|nr:DUF1564 family protein [Leptospira yasudae]TGL74813.1 DUF1564 family protein [Leptospira yasudae]TGL76796.1 DUF1564 family protein [Leptospira yasudae]TGL78188.1 DUF1564 family protein [Leptospira yasudae]